MAILLGFVSALMFGLLDILIAQATRTIGMMYTLVLAHATAAGVLLLYLFAHASSISDGVPSSSLLLLLCIGGSLGLISCVTNLSLYKGLTLGPLTLVSPVTASYGLITMSLAVVVLHELPSLLICLALLLILGGMLLATSAGGDEILIFPRFPISRLLAAFLAIALALAFITAATLFFLLHWLELHSWVILFYSIVEGICMFLACCFALTPSLEQFHQWWASNQHQSGILFGIGAMLGFGVEYFLLSLATAHLGPVHPVVASRLCSAVFLFTYARHQQVKGWGEIKLKHFGLIVLIGILDVLGTISYDFGSSQSTVLVAALSSTYPILPFLFGVIRYHERVRLPQWWGVGIMILGMVGLSFSGK